MSTVGRTRRLTAGLLVALLAAACGQGDAEAPDGQAASDAASASPSASPEPVDTGPAIPDLPGEPFGLAAEGADYAVVGIEHDSALPLRNGPGGEFDLVTTAAPTAFVTATGRDLIRPQVGLWFEVRTSSGTGWADAGHLGLLGVTDDATSRVIDRFGTRPEGEDRVELALEVAAMFTSDDPPSRVTVADEGRPGDVSDVTVDVLGIGDDAVLGFRLVVFLTPVEGGGHAFRTLERTTLCARGVTDDGLCV